MKIIGYTVTARRDDFRRVGRLFKKGEPRVVMALDLTPEQAAFLEASDPRDLKVEPLTDAPPVAQVEAPEGGDDQAPAEAAPARRGKGRKE